MKRVASDNEGLWKGIFSVALGLIMVAWPGLTSKIIITILGTGMLILGGVLLIGYFRRKRKGLKVRVPLAAAIYLLLGLSMVAMPQVFSKTLVVIFGIILVLAGLDQILVLLFGQRSGIKFPPFFYIAPAVVLLIGFGLMFNPEMSERFFIMLFGITSMIYGVVVLYNAYVLKRAVVDVKAIEVNSEEK